MSVAKTFDKTGLDFLDIVVSDLERRQFISLTKLQDVAGNPIAKVLRRHVAQSDLIDDGDKIRCWSMRDTRNAFSAQKIRTGVRVFAPSQGDNAGGPMVMMSLTELRDMLDAARTKPSLVTELTPTDELPAASPITVRMGRRGSGPRLDGGLASAASYSSSSSSSSSSAE
jgi:hypothetical protein